MRLQTFIRVGGALMLSGFLAACGGNGNSSTTTPPVVVPPATLQSQFGTEFAMIFNQSSTSIPAVPTNNAVPALAPAATPIAFPAG